MYQIQLYLQFAGPSGKINKKVVYDLSGLIVGGKDVGDNISHFGFVDG